MPSPHVTRAVVSTTAAGTAQPLTCGRPRQTGRRLAKSGIAVVSAGFVGTSSPAGAVAAINGARGVVDQCESVISVPTIVATLVVEARICAHQYMRRTRTGALRGHPPQKGVCRRFQRRSGGRHSPILSVALPDPISFGFSHGIA